MTRHIEGSNVRPARDIDEGVAREELALEYEARAARYARGGYVRHAATALARAAEIRKGKTNE